MKCKACASEMEFKQKKTIAKDNQQYIGEHDLEDLCSSCLSVAKECYKEYNVNAEVREKALERYCRLGILYQDSLGIEFEQADKAIVRNVEE